MTETVAIETITVPDLAHLEKVIEGMGFVREHSVSRNFHIYNVGKDDNGDIIDVVFPVNPNDWERKHYAEKAANLMDIMGFIRWARPDKYGWYACADLLPPFDKKDSLDRPNSMQVLIRRTNGWYHLARLVQGRGRVYWRADSENLEPEQVSHWKYVEAPERVAA